MCLIQYFMSHSDIFFTALQAQAVLIGKYKKHKDWKASFWRWSFISTTEKKHQHPRGMELDTGR